MKIIGRVLALLLATMAACALADDVVGVMRVNVGTNGLVGVTMPFAPLSDSGSNGLSNIEEFLSDATSSTSLSPCG